jgi:hypothetical protein
MKYNAFISYSHGADAMLASKLEAAVRRIGRPWYWPRGRRLFRDVTTLALTPELWPTISSALDQSEHFILMASPMAAHSAWVRQEICYWLKLNRAKPLIVWTDGTLDWDRSGRQVATETASALPEPLRGAYTSAPLYVDLRWVNQERQVRPNTRGFGRALLSLLQRWIMCLWMRSLEPIFVSAGSYR